METTIRHDKSGQWLSASRGDFSVTVEVHYQDEPVNVSVTEECPWYWSENDLAPDGWQGRGFGGQGDPPEGTGDVLRALRADALRAAAKRWRVVRRRLDMARALAKADV